MFKIETEADVYKTAFVISLLKKLRDSPESDFYKTMVENFGTYSETLLDTVCKELPEEFGIESVNKEN